MCLCTLHKKLPHKIVFTAPDWYVTQFNLAKPDSVPGNTSTQDDRLTHLFNAVSTVHYSLPDSAEHDSMAQIAEHDSMDKITEHTLWLNSLNMTVWLTLKSMADIAEHDSMADITEHDSMAVKLTKDELTHSIQTVLSMTV